MREPLRKKQGGKMQDSLAMLLKTHVEKMSLLCPTTILMKTSQLKTVTRDVHDNTGSCAPG